MIKKRIAVGLCITFIGLAYGKVVNASEEMVGKWEFVKVIGDVDASQLNAIESTLNGVYWEIYEDNQYVLSAGDNKVTGFYEELDNSMLEPGGIDHLESSRNNQSEFIRNSQCTCLANRLPIVIQRDR